jgi:hypothetical protein
MKFVVVIVILTIALTVVWSADDNQDEDSIWPNHEFIVKTSRKSDINYIPTENT